MATGDIGNNIKKLQKEIKLIKYGGTVDLKGMTQGDPAAFLPLYHYAFTSYSHAVAEEIATSDTELFGKSDLRFMEAVYKILRDMFKYKPPITKDQFFSSSFAERKVIMSTGILEMIREKNRKLQVGQNANRSRLQQTAPVTSKVLSRPKTTEPKSSSESFSVQKGIPQKDNRRRLSKFEKPRPGTTGNVAPSKQDKAAHVVNELRVSQLAGLKQSMFPGSSRLKVAADKIHLDPGNGCLSTPSISRVCSSSVEVVTIPRGSVGSGSFIENVDINAATHMQHATDLQSHNNISDLQLQMLKMEQVISGLVSSLTNLENTMDCVAICPASSEIHPNITDAIAKLQQHIETLMARFVLLENRMTLVESKLGDVPSNPTLWNGTGNMSSPTTEAPTAIQADIHSVSPNIELVNGVNENPQTSLEKEPSLPVVSPIKQIAVLGDFNLEKGQSAIIQDDEFSVEESEACRSSTPTSFPVLKLEKSEASFSCQFDDDSTQDQVERIKHILKDTQDMLKPIEIYHVE